ncbi:MAG: hypothetical protein UY16_C0029G0020 [Candidatus Gottesmanbacteria bacterium GW2011_GWA2_47_9]|uniref:PIN domain-containing protein n=1 Tax=Candidatus Gottesmanbacteria bacterium GW2011_GWA2_47_9 TaxID=1618445 RepID=A0A0G1TZX1_9BACT|nr:MAG: hypothetical protein UY16_C0029G0020 [Candidatus Gottesmanbacteria bacterium GW2011_GWA2_47_9]
MKKLLVDSSFYVSLALPADTNHHKADTYFRRIATGEFSCITTEDVLKESLTAISQRLGKASSISYYHLITKLTKVLTVTKPQWQNGLHRFLDATRQKDISVIDCILWAIYEETKADAILTFDRHFRSLGVKVFP